MSNAASHRSIPASGPRALTADDYVDLLAEDVALARRSVAALGPAIQSVAHRVSPSLTRAVQARENLYADIEDEFGLFSSAEAGQRMGSRSAARRNAATAARREGRLLGLRRGGYLLFPGFQFDAHGVRPVIADLVETGRKHHWHEASLIEWLCSPTTYLDGVRPVDVLDDAERVVQVAQAAFGVQW